MDEQREGTLSTADIAGRTEPASNQPGGAAPDVAAPQAVDDQRSGGATIVREEAGVQRGTPGGPETVGRGAADGARESLFVQEEAGRFRDRWTDVQALFVDEPRRAVEEADALVAEAITVLAGVFADERQRLEGQWSGGGDASTEDLRQALRRYRSFFDRLLSV